MRMNNYFPLCWLWCFVLDFTVAFKITVPQSPLLGIFDRPVVLLCTYTASQGHGLDGLVITWQRTRDKAVLHSFYGGRDQLDKQHQSFRNRTRLFYNKLQDGNASLWLDRVRASDKDRYQCSVTNLVGGGTEELQLQFAAFYTEPQLTIQVYNGNVTFQYESKGYPKPDVDWLDPEGQKLSSPTTIDLSEGSDGLFTLRTQMVLGPNQQANYTFTVKNQLLGQVIRRPVRFTYDALRSHMDSLGHQRIYICYTAIILFFFL